MQKKNGHGFATVSGIFFIFLSILTFIIFISHLADGPRRVSQDTAYLVTTLVSIALFITMAVMMFIKRVNAGTMVITGLILLLSFHELSMPVYYGTSSRDVWGMLALLTLFILTFLNAFNGMKGASKVTHVLWFIPLLFLLLEFAAPYIDDVWRNPGVYPGEYNYFWIDRYDRSQTPEAVQILHASFYLMAFGMMAAWVTRKPGKPEPDEDARPVYYTGYTGYMPGAYPPPAAPSVPPVRPAVPVQQPAAPVQQPAGQDMSDISKLKQYKELLDDGLITEEEYEAKKKKLLGL